MIFDQREDIERDKNGSRSYTWLQVRNVRVEK
jgi:hypothetical protein